MILRIIWWCITMMGMGVALVTDVHQSTDAQKGNPPRCAQHHRHHHHLLLLRFVFGWERQNNAVIHEWASLGDDGAVAAGVLHAVPVIGGHRGSGRDWTPSASERTESRWFFSGEEEGVYGMGWGGEGGRVERRGGDIEGHLLNMCWSISSGSLQKSLMYKHEQEKGRRHGGMLRPSDRHPKRQQHRSPGRWSPASSAVSPVRLLMTHAGINQYLGGIFTRVILLGSTCLALASFPRHIDFIFYCKNKFFIVFIFADSSSNNLVLIHTYLSHRKYFQIIARQY